MPAVVGIVTFLSAAGTVFFLVSVAQMGAYILHPGGLAALRAEMVSQGIPEPQSMTAFLASSLFGFGIALTAMALHLVTFVALQRRTAFGWVMAVLVSALWSLGLIGIPFLWLLLKSDTRRAFGLT
jgi:hypothetical protein